MKAKLLGLFAIMMLLFTACDSGSSTTAQKAAETPKQEEVKKEEVKTEEAKPAETAKPTEEAPAEAKPAS
jgi:hypothetical protein